MSDTPAPASRHAELARAVAAARAAYYAGEPTMTDADFDAAWHEMLDLEEADPSLTEGSPSQRVGAPATGRTKVAHRSRMLSLTDVFSVQEATAWSAALGDPYLTAEVKYDGCAVELVYSSGLLTSAVTRGDGMVGEDVTEAVRHIGSVPAALLGGALHERIEVRGEVYIPPSAFQDLNEARLAQVEAARERMSAGGRREALPKPFANPRNAATGSLLAKDPALAGQRRLAFVAHGVGGWDGPEADQHDVYETLAAMGLPVSPHTKVVHGPDQIEEYIASFASHRTDLECEIDGIVLKVDDLDAQEELGATSRVPRWAVAYKYPPLEVATTVRDIVVQVGRTGRATPVVVMDPVTVSGSTVARATLHNADLVASLDVRVGDRVAVRKAGEIIPEVVGVLGDHAPGSEPWAMSTACPACGAPLAPRHVGDVDLRCTSTRSCPAQVVARLERLGGRDGLDIDGFGTAVATALVTGRFNDDGPLLPDETRLFSLGGADLAAIRMPDGTRPFVRKDGGLTAAAGAFLDDLDEARRNAPLDRVMISLSIPGVGRDACRALVRNFGSWDAIAGATAEQVTAVDGIGPGIAADLASWLAEPWHRELIDAWRADGVAALSGQADETEAVPQTLAGMTVVVTGALDSLDRAGVKEAIESHGGKASGSVSRRTSVVVVGDKPGSKAAKAAELGIRTINEAAFLRLLDGEDS